MDISQLPDLLKDLEYSSFSLSIRKGFPDEEFKYHKEGLSLSPKSALNHDLRIKISELLGVPWSLNGDVNILLDFDRDTISVSPSPLYIFAKYNKFSRNLSQTRWVKYTSVEDYIVQAASEWFGAENAYLHGAGREDVDVLMLGEGRPSIIEIKSPMRRSISLDGFAERVSELSEGNVRLNDLRYVNKDWVAMIKEARFDKTYLAKVRFDRKVSPSQIENILRINHVDQRTPKRVLHRRANLVRKRRIYDIKYLGTDDNQLHQFEIYCESGTYIKELISGDDGRTIPSFASVTGISAECVQLDVIKVHDYISNWW